MVFKDMPSFCKLCWYGIALINLASALSPISIKGTKLYNEDGSQFFVKGISYHFIGDGVVDALINNDQCQIDAGLMKTLGINTIRVYEVDPGEDHDACMQTFASQGIYVWLDLPPGITGISQDPPAWTTDLYNSWSATIDSFAKYDNLLAFGVGSEIIHDANTVAAGPCIKAAVRDLKAFRDARQYRKIPIAYTTGDEITYRSVVADYLACGQKSDTIDLYGLATSSWCNNTSVYESEYDKVYEEYQHLNIPVLFSEVACMTIVPRNFSEIATILGTVFPATFSGAIVYEWSSVNNDFGIVEYNETDYSGFPTTRQDYNVLQTVLADARPLGTSSAVYTPSITPPACPTSNTDWPLNAGYQLPTLAGLDLSTVTPITTTNTDTFSFASATITSVSPIDVGASTSTAPTSGILIKVISITIAVILSSIIIFFKIRRIEIAKRKAKITSDEKEGQSKEDSENAGKSELPAISSARVIPKSELDTGVSPISPGSPLVIHDKSQGFVMELGGRHCARYPLEMKGCMPVIHELDGSEKERS